MSRLTLHLLGIKIWLLVRIMRIADRAYTALIDRTSTAYINALAKRNATRDYITQHDPRGCIGDELISCVLIVGGVAALTVIAIEQTSGIPLIAVASQALAR